MEDMDHEDDFENLVGVATAGGHGGFFWHVVDMENTDGETTRERLHVTFKFTFAFSPTRHDKANRNTCNTLFDLYVRLLAVTCTSKMYILPCSSTDFSNNRMLTFVIL